MKISVFQVLNYYNNNTRNYYCFSFFIDFSFIFYSFFASVVKFNFDKSARVQVQDSFKFFLKKRVISC